MILHAGDEVGRGETCAGDDVGAGGDDGDGNDGFADIL